MKNTFIKTTLAVSFAMASSLAIADMSDHKNGVRQHERSFNEDGWHGNERHGHK